jgi:hypothetical protein
MEYYNYTKLSSEKDRLYNIGGYYIEGGISYSLLISFLIFEAIFQAIFILVLKLNHTSYLSHPVSFVVALGLGGLFGYLANTIKIQQYTFFSYIASVFVVSRQNKYTSLREEASKGKMRIKFVVTDPISGD